MSDAKEIKLRLRYEQDSRRYHRFKIIDPEGDVTGSVYFSKDMKQLPDRIALVRESN